MASPSAPPAAACVAMPFSERQPGPAATERHREELAVRSPLDLDKPGNYQLQLRAFLPDQFPCMRQEYYRIIDQLLVLLTVI